MSDQSDQHYEELLKTVGELEKKLLLDILHRLDRLESADEAPVLTRLPSLETAIDRESAMRQITSRIEALESQLEDED